MSKGGGKWVVGGELDVQGELLVNGEPINSEGQQGPKGDPGPEGPKGDTGSQGPKGDTGSQGPAGTDGVGIVNITLDGSDLVFEMTEGDDIRVTLPDMGG